MVGVRDSLRAFRFPRPRPLNGITIFLTVVVSPNPPRNEDEGDIIVMKKREQQGLNLVASSNSVRPQRKRFWSPAFVSCSPHSSRQAGVPEQPHWEDIAAAFADI